MKYSEIIMGMPITVEITDPDAAENLFSLTFGYLKKVDEKFSTYKPESEISKINRGEILEKHYSPEMKEVFKLSEETKKLTNGYFDIRSPEGFYDPSGLVKGWAILNAAEILKQKGCKNFYVEAGGDIQTFGKNAEGESWSIGIKNPFNQKEIVKVLYISAQGMATSGTYIRGQHIYNPKDKGKPLTDIVSLTVVGPNVYEADRFATAAFAMGREGIKFIENLEGLEGYMIDKQGMAVMTSGLENFTIR